ncbi:hypothetical protein Bbelb_000110 [Branchiostoma belcheri]|nr:hypothetical protein Bbelb_000110 [Branchiostoma belcheri]
MEEATDGSSVEDDTNHVLSVGSTSRDLQTAYPIISLVLSVGCGLLLIFLVWKKEYLQKPSHYLRCNLAVDDIVFTGCLIPVRIYALFRQDTSGGQTTNRHYNVGLDEEAPPRRTSVWISGDDGIRRFTSEANNKNVVITVKLFIHGIIHGHKDLDCDRY